MAFWQLFISNVKILFRNTQALIWNILLPLILYLGISTVDLSVFLGGNVPYKNYLLPGILAFTIMHTGIHSLSFWMIDLRERGIIKRFQVTPVSYTKLLTALVTSRLVLIYFQIFVIGTIGLLFLQAVLQGSVLAILALILIGGGVFLTIGFIISVVSNTNEAASPMITAITVVFICLGNIFVPPSTFPAGIRFFAGKLPITYLTDGLRDNFMRDHSFVQTLPQIMPLLGWLVGLFCIAVIAAGIRQRKSV